METIEVRADIAMGLRAEANHLGISEAEMVERAWAEFADKHRSEIRRGFIRRPWLIFRPGAFRLLTRHS